MRKWKPATGWPRSPKVYEAPGFGVGSGRVGRRRGGSRQPGGRGHRRCTRHLGLALGLGALVVVVVEAPARCSPASPADPDPAQCGSAILLGRVDGCWPSALLTCVARRSRPCPMWVGNSPRPRRWLLAQRAAAPLSSSRLISSAIVRMSWSSWPTDELALTGRTAIQLAFDFQRDRSHELVFLAHR